MIDRLLRPAAYSAAIMLVASSLAPRGAVSSVVAGMGGGRVSGSAAGQVPQFDKLVHFGAYATLAFLFLLAEVWNPFERQPKGRSAAVVLTVAVLLGGLIELAQGPVGRTTDALDFLANGAGVFAGWMVWSAWRGRTGRVVERFRHDSMTRHPSLAPVPVRNDRRR